MTDGKPHFSFWFIGVVGLIWNLLGCYNYILQTSPDAIAQMPEVYQLIIENRPMWATVAFALAVFGGAVGCILLLLRKRMAVPLLWTSLIGIVGTSVFTFIVVGMSPIMVLTVLIGAALLWYSTIVRREGWLRI